MKKSDFNQLPLASRRRIFEWSMAAFGGALALRGIVPDLTELLVPTARAQSGLSAKPTYFIEINLRDQFDFSHLFTPPGVAQASNLIRGEKGNQVCYFDAGADVRNFPLGNGIFLTKDSAMLAPHVDTIACVDLCELPVGDVHGHEGGNATRSPGRLKRSDTDGRKAMWKFDVPNTDSPGEMALFSTSPTPACLHNHTQKTLATGSPPNDGAILKIHTPVPEKTYHFSADLSNGSLTRYFSKEDLLRDYPGVGVASATKPSSPMKSDPNKLNGPESQALKTLLRALDTRMLQRRNAAAGVVDAHLAQVEGALKNGDLAPASLGGMRSDIKLTEAERAEWASGSVVDQVPDSKTQSWEACALGLNMLLSGKTRTVSIEFSYTDWHDQRPETAVRHYARMIANPLAKMIEKLKQAEIYDRTVIVVYTTDGGRPMHAGGSGNIGRNGALIAGGAVNGGYWGDIRLAGDVDGGNTFTFHAPDPNTGSPHPVGTSGNDLRVSGGSLWKSVLDLAGVPLDVLNAYPGVAEQPLLKFLKKA